MDRARGLAARAVATALALLGLGASLLPNPAAAMPLEPGPAPVLTVVPTTNAFPVPAPYEASFTDDWHACRDGCRRRHKGNDVFADEGTPIVAVETGLIARVDGVDDSNGGLSIWLAGDSGVAYWYAHNSANHVSAGQRVSRGEIIGQVGRTGNARTTPPHIHFQVNLCGELSSREPCTVNPFELLSGWSRLAGGQVGGGPDAVGLYRRSAASAELRIEGGSELPAFTFGRPQEGTTLPVAGDWNGDGRDSLGLYRRRDASFVLRDDAGSTLPPIAFGWPHARDSLPVAGDWDGDGRDSLGLYRARDGIFRLRDEQGRDLPPVTFGAVGAPELPVAGDWDGDGRDTVGVYQRTKAQFRLSGPDPTTPDAGATTVTTGERPAVDLIPVAGDWNGLDVVTLGDLQAIFGPVDDEGVVIAQLPLLNDALRRSDAVSPARKAAFLATIHHESAFRADAVERSNRSTFRGRGFIQLTGRRNYRAAGTDLGLDLEGEPDLAAHPAISAEVAAWYWTVARDINRAADRLDMAAVNIAVGFRPSTREDTQRCGDFVRALKWFNGGELPGHVNCDRAATPQLVGRPGTLRSVADGSWTGEAATHRAGAAGTAPDNDAATSRPTAAGTATPPAPAQPASTPATAPTTPPPRPGGTTGTTPPSPTSTASPQPPTTTTSSTTTSTTSSSTTTTSSPTSSPTTTTTTTTTVTCDLAMATTTAATSAPCSATSTTSPPSSTDTADTTRTSDSPAPPPRRPRRLTSGRGNSRLRRSLSMAEDRSIRSSGGPIVLREGGASFAVTDDGPARTARLVACEPRA
jgi:predicted chitinase